MSDGPSTSDSLTPDDLRAVDLSHGLSLSGRLTKNDLDRALKLRRYAIETKPSTPRWLNLLPAVFFVVWIVVSSTKGRQGEPSMLLAFFSMSIGIAFAIGPFLLALKYINRRNQQACPVAPWALPHQWIFQDKAIYSLREAVLEELPWSSKSRRLAPELLTFELSSGKPNLFPKRFASNEFTWNEFIATASRKLPPATNAEKVADLDLDYYLTSIARLSMIGRR